MSETIKLSEALSAAQNEFKPIKKDLEVSFGTTKYKYADLAAVIEATQPALTKHGLSVTQCAEFLEDRFVLHTRLMHKSGESVSSYWPLPSQAKPQEMGSALTYARRYSLSAILNVASEADDDGQSGNSAKITDADAKKAMRAKKEQNKFFLIDSDGVEHGFATGSLYLEGVKEAFKTASDKQGFWESNAVKFDEYRLSESTIHGGQADNAFSVVKDVIVATLAKNA